MNPQELQQRTKRFAGVIIRLVETLPRTTANNVVGKQLIRSATSMAANYRACSRARSKADFINKLGIVEEETDETLFWLEMLIESGKVKENDISDINKEAKELVAIFSAAHKTSKQNRK